MSHNHQGPPSNSAWFAGCRDGLCIRAHETYERTKPAPAIRAAKVISTPTPIHTEDQAPAEPAMMAEPYKPAPWVAPPMVEMTVVEEAAYEPRPYRGMPAIRSLRRTAGV